MITPRPPGYRCDTFAQHLQKTVSAASVAATRAPPAQMLWRREGQEGGPQYADFSGCLWLPVWLPGGGPSLRHISGSQFCLVNGYPIGHLHAGIPDRVIACGQ